MLTGLSILIVEREPIIAMALEDALKEAGARVVICKGNAEGLSKLESHPFDCAVLDILVSSKSCRSLTEELHAKRVGYVAVSGYYSADDYGALVRIDKPYDVAQVVVAVNRVAKARNIIIPPASS